MTSDYSQNPISSPKTLKQRIMRRIYFLFMVRETAPLAFDCLGIVIVAFIATLFVSVKDVWGNLSMAQSSGNLSNFSLSAFSATELETKLLLVVLGVVGFFAVRHLKRAVRAMKTLRQGAESPKPEARSSKNL